MQRCDPDFILATTKDTDGWGYTNYTARAQLSWTFNATGNMTNIGGNIAWKAGSTATSGAIRGPNTWRELDGAEPPHWSEKPANSVFNSTAAAWSP